MDLQTLTPIDAESHLPPSLKDSIPPKPAEILAWLRDGQINAAMSVIRETLIKSRTTPEELRRDKHWASILNLVGSGSWVGLLTPEPRLSSATAANVDAITTAIDTWMDANSTTLRTLAARDRYLLRHIDANDCDFTSAPQVALFLPAISRMHERLQEPTHFVPRSDQATVHAIVAQQFALFDCGLIYIPLLPAGVSSRTLEPLLMSFVSWLKPRGELLLGVCTELPEAPLLRAVVGRCPAVLAPERLLRLAQGIDAAAAHVHLDHANNLAFLHLQRH